MLRPGGLLFLGVYGGESSKGPAAHDWHDPPPFFSLRTDAEIQKFVGRFFEVEDFHVVTADACRFQPLPLRRPTA